jgi:hypothetical protein
VHSYRVVSEIDSVPELTGLMMTSHIEGSPRTGGRITLGPPFGLRAVVDYEPAVGCRCQVFRSGDGQDQQCGGAIERITPQLVITLDGTGFR